MPTTCPHCSKHFPKSDTINSRHKAVCPGWQAALGARKPRLCLCGHEATSLTQMKRHRRKCEVWESRDRGKVQMARLAETLQVNHGEGVTCPRQIPGVEVKRKATIRERYGADNVFSRESTIFDKVQASLEGKRPILKGQDNPFAWPEIQEKIRQANLDRYGVESPQQSPEIRAKTQATNLKRYGHKEVLAAPEVRAKIVATNEDRYGGPAPAHSPEVVEKARQTNQERWGVDWTCQHPDVRRRQLETMEANYGSHFFASEEGRARIQATLIERYGVDHPAKIDGFWDKAVATFIRKYGATHPLLLTEFLDKRRATCQERYGVDSPMQGPEVWGRAVQAYKSTCQRRYGVPNTMMIPEIALKALKAAGGRGGPNLLERRFASLNPELLYTGNGTFWRWLPKLGHHKNPDFIVPGPDPKKPKKGVTKVVELFGNYWHSRMFTGSANFEHEQQLINAFLDIGVDCLVIWESEFKADPQAVQQRVSNFLLWLRRAIMNKIASPQDLQHELQLLITACAHGSMGSPKVSRVKMAARLDELAARVSAVPTPAEADAKTAEMLRKKLAGAEKLYNAMKGFDYTAYNIGDFFKSDLPKLRKTSDTITKQKAVLEAQLYRFMRQAKDDLKRLGKSR